MLVMGIEEKDGQKIIKAVDWTGATISMLGPHYWLFFILC